MIFIKLAKRQTEKIQEDGLDNRTQDLLNLCKSMDINGH